MRAPALVVLPLAACTAADAGPSQPSAPDLDPSEGYEIGLVVEAWLSPHQEPGEEADTPPTVPPAFRSTTPSLTRAEREDAGHRGHGQIRFTKDLSRAWVDVDVEGVDAASVNMFHVHCGQPGILGPILVDFSLVTDIQDNLADGQFSVELTNDAITETANHSHDPVAAFTMGCTIQSPSLSGLTPSKVSTIAGMAHIARQGELYFNLHTTGQTYFGDMRGQLQ
ncbi:MAG TPA: CHRD domain-containing protein [Myxococcota bacterium]|nr:CHRD domain-containing protein [Myxococcota bacterium]